MVTANALGRPEPAEGDAFQPPLRPASAKPMDARPASHLDTDDQVIP